MKTRITLLWLVFLAGAGLLIARASWIQLSKQPRLASLSRRQFQSQIVVQPRRGSIQDRNGETLAGSTDSQSLAANPAKVKRRSHVAKLLARALDLPYSRVLERLLEKREFVWLKRQLTEADFAQLRKWGLLNGDGDLAPSLFLVRESKRVYPHGPLAAHVLGSVNIDGDGLEGVELWLNERLKGKRGALSSTRDALGRPSFVDTAASRSIQDGEGAQLTLDASLQFAVEEILRQSVRKHSARAGSVIVMNAVSGEVLAMANEPSFDPNLKGVSPDHKRNRVLTDGFEPGSTLKAVLAASALSHGWKLTDTVWGERGSFKVQGKRISEAEAHERFEWVSLAKMLQVSSNVAAAKIALKLGPEAYADTLQKMGIGLRTGTGFPGEIAGRVPARKTWKPLTTANIGFGQGVLTTPMQITRAYAALANGGWLVQPTLLKAPVAPMAPQRVLTEGVSRDVTRALESVIAMGGTGVKAAIEGYRLAGKTGTAQMVDPRTGTYARDRHIASFVGYTVDVEPKIVVFAAVQEPRGGYYAAEIAAPLFKEAMAATLQRLGVQPTLPVAPRVLAQASRKVSAPAPGVQVQTVAPVPTVQSPAMVTPENAPAEEASESLAWAGLRHDGRPLWKMPPLVGLSAREALRSLKGHEFQVELSGSGQSGGLVTRQWPEAGKGIADGDPIRISLSENATASTHRP